MRAPPQLDHPGLSRSFSAGADTLASRRHTRHSPDANGAAAGRATAAERLKRCRRKRGAAASTGPGIGQVGAKRWRWPRRGKRSQRRMKLRLLCSAGASRHLGCSSAHARDNGASVRQKCLMYYTVGILEVYVVCGYTLGRAVTVADAAGTRYRIALPVSRTDLHCRDIRTAERRAR